FLSRFLNCRRLVRVLGSWRFVRFGLREQRAGCQQTSDQKIDRLKHSTRNGETVSLSNRFQVETFFRNVRGRRDMLLHVLDAQKRVPPGKPYPKLNVPQSVHLQSGMRYGYGTYPAPLKMMNALRFRSLLIAGVLCLSLAPISFAAKSKSSSK